MAELIEGRAVSGFRAGAALTQYKLVHIVGGALEHAGAADTDTVGVVQRDAQIGDAVTFVPLGRISMHICHASGNITTGGEVYQAANGEVAGTGTVQIGIAASDAAANEWVSVIPQ